MLDKVSEFDKGWLVGMVEGEGCIYAGQGRFAVTVTSTDLENVAKVEELVGAGNIDTQPAKPPRKARHTWRLGLRSQVKELLLEIGPHLSPRRRRKAEEVLGLIETKDKTPPRPGGRKNTQSRFPGVRPSGKKWTARTGAGGGRYLGTFGTEEEAAQAYEIAKEWKK